MSSDTGDSGSTSVRAADDSDRGDVPDGTGSPEADGTDEEEDGEAPTDGEAVADEEAGDDDDGDENADEEVTAERPDETVPAVELGLYQLSVKVTGRSADSIDDIEASARRLMDYLVDTAEALEDSPDDRGLG